MAQNLFDVAGTGSRSYTLLDANFTELYALRNLVTIASGNASYSGRLTSASGGFTAIATGSVPLNGVAGALNFGYADAAVTSTTDSFVVWAASTFPLNSFSISGSLGFVARNFSGAGIFWATQNITRVVLDYSGNLLQVSSGGIGYGTGSGGTVTQATSKATAVTLNKTNGAITVHNASLAAGALISFSLNNTTIAATDVVLCCMKDGTGTTGAYLISPQPLAGGAVINVRNLTGGALAEAFTINFAVIKAVTS